MRITAIEHELSGMFVFIHADGYVIRMTPRCLLDLGWRIGTLIK